MKDFNEKFIFRYLKKAGIPYLKKEVTDTLLNHPGTPSLKAVSDTLQGLNVKTMAVGLDMADLDQVEFPVIAHFKKGHGEFVLLESKQKEEIRYFQQDGLKTELLKDFEKRWSGKTLLLQKPDEMTIKDPEIYYWKKYGMTVLSVITGLLAFVLIISGVFRGPINQALYLSLLLLLNLSGLGLSAYLYWIHLNKSTRDDKLCRKTKTVDCTAVLHSKWSKLFGLFNWAQVGILYFFGQSLGLFSGLIGYEYIQSTTFLLSVLALLAGCFSLYSVFLQAFVIKKWCSLCMICQAILLATIALNFYHGTLWHIELKTVTLLSIGFSHLSGLFVIQVYTRQMEMKEGLKQKTIQLARFKGDKGIFQHLLQKQTKALDYSHLKGVVSIGHIAAPNEILMVASLHCGPCISMFRELVGFIKGHPDKLRLKIVFTMGLTDKPEEIAVNSRLINLAITDKESRVVEAINSWYDAIGKKNGEEIWVDQYMPDSTMNPDEMMLTIKEHQKWLAKAMIFKTPTLFFNQYELPQIYADKESLGHLLD